MSNRLIRNQFQRSSELTVEYVNDHGGPRRFGNGAGVVTGVPLSSVGDVQATDGSVGQQVRFHAVPKSNVKIAIIFTAKVATLDIFSSYHSRVDLKD
jgi:hypothetical protein